MEAAAQGPGANETGSCDVINSGPGHLRGQARRHGPAIDAASVWATAEDKGDIVLLPMRLDERGVMAAENLNSALTEGEVSGCESEDSHDESAGIKGIDAPPSYSRVLSQLGSQ